MNVAKLTRPVALGIFHGTPLTTPNDRNLGHLSKIGRTNSALSGEIRTQKTRFPKLKKRNYETKPNLRKIGEIGNLSTGEYQAGQVVLPALRGSSPTAGKRQVNVPRTRNNGLPYVLFGVRRFGHAFVQRRLPLCRLEETAATATTRSAPSPRYARVRVGASR